MPKASSFKWARERRKQEKDAKQSIASWSTPTCQLLIHQHDECKHAFAVKANELLSQWVAKCIIPVQPQSVGWHRKALGLIGFAVSSWSCSMHEARKCSRSDLKQEQVTHFNGCLKKTHTRSKLWDQLSTQTIKEDLTMICIAIRIGMWCCMEQCFRHVVFCAAKKLPGVRGSVEHWSSLLCSAKGGRGRKGGLMSHWSPRKKCTDWVADPVGNRAWCKHAHLTSHFLSPVEPFWSVLITIEKKQRGESSENCVWWEPPLTRCS